MQSTWISALRAAASVARQSASKETEVLRAVSNVFNQMNLQGSVALLDPDGKLEIRAVSLGAPLVRALQRVTNLQIEGFRFAPETVDVYQRALERGQSVFHPHRNDLTAQLIPRQFMGFLPRIARWLGDQPVIVAPLILGEDRLGALNVSAPWLSEDDLPMLEALADHIAIALGHTRARAELESAWKRERMRNLVVQAAASALEPPVVMGHVIQLAVQELSADAGAIALLDADTSTLIVPYLYGLPPDTPEYALLHQDGLIWRVIEAKQPILWTDYREDPDASPDWIQSGVCGAMGVPLIIAEECIGAMGLFSLHEKRVFSKDELAMAQAIASTAAIAINNARLYEEATLRAEEAQVLIRTSQSISASLDIDTVLHLITEQAKTLLKADASRIHLMDTSSNTLRCVVAVGPASEASMAQVLMPGEGITGQVIETGLPSIVNAAGADPGGVLIPDTPADEIECLALAPLSVRQRAIGAMTVRRLGHNRPFVPSDLNLLTAFASQAAVAIENAHLFGQIAEQAQRLESEVSERTRDLARSEAHFRALVETSLAGILQIDPQGRFVYVNQRFADMLELQPAELIGRPVTSYEGFIPRDHQAVLERFYARLRGDLPSQDVHELTLITTSGRRIPALLAASVIRDEDGTPTGVTGLILDISEQKTLEAALQAERDRLDALLTNIGDGVMVTDPDGIIEYVNPGWERLNGYTAAEALGKTPRLISSGQHTKEFYSALWNTILRGETWRGEVVNCRKDGAFYDAALTITPVSDDAGQTINFVAVQHDISVLKELDRLKSQFVSDVSPELRTPLTNIRLYLDLLGRTDIKQEKITRYLQTLSRESERLANLIDDLLSLSRLDAGAVALDPKRVNINHLLSALVQDRQTLAAKRGLRLNMQAEGGLPEITADERLLTQVFTNLLTNAMNYTQAGGEITLRTHSEVLNADRWVLAEVEDSGLGIPTEELELIFQRFFRGSASHTTNAPGTGLGLAICREIIDRHGGHIAVESEGVKGGGSSFTVWLPLNPKQSPTQR